MRTSRGLDTGAGVERLKELGLFTPETSLRGHNDSVKCSCKEERNKLFSAGYRRKRNGHTLQQEPFRLQCRQLDSGLGWLGSNFMQLRGVSG